MSKAIKEIRDRLKNKSIILFLGAGVNHEVKNANGENFPLSKDLTSWIAKDILGDSSLKNEGLDEIAEIARFKIGDKKFDNYIKKKFKDFEPGITHKKLSKLPWKRMYTTNFDTLFENAFTNKKPSQYYKLHGCVLGIGHQLSRLLITKEDYSESEKYRNKIFKLLKKDLSTFSFLFIGYSLRDINFRAILSECRKEVGLNYKMPKSYSVQKCGNKIQKTFWLKKYNIQIINKSAEDFVGLLCKNNEYRKC